MAVVLVLCDTESVPLPEALCEALALPVALAQRVMVALALCEAAGEADAPPVPESTAETVMLGEPVGLTVEDSLTESDTVWEPLGVGRRVTSVLVGEAEGLPADVGERVSVCDREKDCVPEPLAEAMSEPECVGEGERDRVSVGERV